jgi:hypothetical protein
MSALEEFEAAMEHAGQGHYEAAIESFKRAIEQSTADQAKRDVWWNVAVCHMRLGQIEEARAAADLAGRTASADDELIETWADLHEAGAGGVAALGFELKQSGDFRGALAAFEAALHDPDLDDDTRGYLYGRIALCHLELLDWGRAEEYAAVQRDMDRAEYDTRRAAKRCGSTPRSATSTPATPPRATATPRSSPGRGSTATTSAAAPCTRPDSDRARPASTAVDERAPFAWERHEAQRRRSIEQPRQDVSGLVGGWDCDDEPASRVVLQHHPPFGHGDTQIK